ncbi:MAG: hypothetical protein V4608_09060 [Bacteroidota bacterium]
MFAQVDSTAYSRDYEFKEGVFLSFYQLKANDPISKSSIISSIPKEELTFFKQLMVQSVFKYTDSTGKEREVSVSDSWGYCQNRSVYINYNKTFNKLNVIGTLCHFTAIVAANIGYRDPMNFGLNTTDELHQFVYDTQTNKIYDFTAKSMEMLIINDMDLYKQFTSLKRRDKENSIFIYLRKYNDKHPLFLSSK